MTMPSLSHREGPAHRAEQVRRVLEACGRLGPGGEAIDDAALLAQHPELMPELADELRKLRFIEDARRLALQAPPAPEQEGPPVAPAGAALSSGPESPGDLLECLLIPDYDLLRPIGAGAFGQVWLARNRLDGSFVAIKVIPTSRPVELEGI